MKKLISFLSILVLLVTVSLFCSTAQAETKFKVTATSTTNSVKLKWIKVKGAKHYKIYRKTAKTKYKLVKKTTKRTYTNKKLKANKNYTYKVKAFKKNKNGKFYSFKSAVKSVKTKGEIPIATITRTWNETTTKTTVVNTDTTTTTKELQSTTVPVKTTTVSTIAQPTTVQTETTTVATTQPTVLSTQTTIATTQPTVSSIGTTSTTTQPTTIKTETTTVVSTIQPTIPLQPITTEAKGYEELVKEARLRELHQNPDTAHATLDDIRIDYYYGTYNDCIVVMIDDRFTTENCMVYYIDVEGVTFYYGSNRRILVLKDGIFYQLQQAYDNGFLTYEDLKTIADIHNPSFISTTTTTQPTTTSAEEYFNNLTPKEQLELISYDLGVDISSGAVVDKFELKKYMYTDKVQYDDSWGYSAKLYLDQKAYNTIRELPSDELSSTVAKDFMYHDEYSWWNAENARLIKRISKETLNLYSVKGQQWTHRYSGEKVYAYLGLEGDKLCLFVTTNLTKKCEDFIPKKLNKDPKDYSNAGEYLDSLTKEEQLQVIVNDTEMFMGEGTTVQNFEKIKSNICDGGYKYIAKLKLSKSGFDYFNEILTNEDPTKNIKYVLENGKSQPWWDLNETNVVKYSSGTYNAEVSTEGIVPTVWIDFMTAEIDGEYYLFIETDHTKINEFYLLSVQLPELFEHQGSLKSYYESLNKRQFEKVVKKDFDYEIPYDSELMNIEYSNSHRWLPDEEDNLKELWGYSAKFKLTKEGYEELAEYFASKENSWDHSHDPQKQGIDYSWWDLTSEDVIHTNATIGKGQLYCANGHLVTILTIWNYSWLAEIDGEYYLYLNTPLSDTTCEWYELKNKIE